MWSKKAMAVKEAKHTTGIVWKVRQEERCEVGVTVVRCVATPTQEMRPSSCVDRVVNRL